ncbi:DUF1642 domain-containing protein [Listeria booriae]|uniref:DUF1642 domain-containing protein n=1 Tax=Listeria booriae TaxID=1552123 RepID=UPI001624922D|nr:DUF1642 domain-containing protein [Listeria booriae]MBC2369928.1 DUF1642 domain-containing protein [Listeria booriae]
MTQKFKIGDRVQIISDGKQKIAEVVAVNELLKTYQICKPNREHIWISEDYLAPAPVLVKVPQFVADYIEDAKKGVYNTLAAAFNCHTKNWDVASWLENFDDLDGLDYDKAYKNQELFARAWLDGYEVEEEPLYYIKLPALGFLVDEPEVDFVASKEFASKFNKAQIKAVDERYWQFAVPVEELEEGEG